MTRLTAFKRLARLLPEDFIRDHREQIVELDASGLYMRGKGTRRRYFMGWGDVFALAVRLTLQRERAAKKKERELRRKQAA